MGDNIRSSRKWERRNKNDKLGIEERIGKEGEGWRRMKALGQKKMMEREEEAGTKTWKCRKNQGGEIMRRWGENEKVRDNKRVGRNQEGGERRRG